MGQFDDFVSRYFRPEFSGPSVYGIRCWLAINQEGGPVSYAYARDLLLYHPGVGHADPYVTGELNQLFSDRIGTQPFDINSGDRTIVTLKPWWAPDQQS